MNKKLGFFLLVTFLLPVFGLGWFALTNAIFAAVLVRGLGLSSAGWAIDALTMMSVGLVFFVFVAPSLQKRWIELR